MRFSYLYLIPLTICGILIHALGLFGIEYNQAPAWIHFVMLIVDTAIVIGLVLNTSWGYWLAIALYIEQIMLQTYFLGMQSWFETSLWLNIPVPLLCLAAFLFLLIDKKTFTLLSKNDWGRA